MLESILKESKKYFNVNEVKMIKEAYYLAEELHKNQFRASGEPYIIHPLNVALILLKEMKLHNANSICAALLHDTIEDTGITKEDLSEKFNEDIANLVSSVSKITDLNFSSQTEEEQYNTCILVRGLMHDYRVIFIKLADRLHNMRTLEYKSRAKQKEKSSETLTLFAPLADRVGANLVKNELKDIAFRYLNAHKYREIKTNITNYFEIHQKELDEIRENINATLNSYNIKNTVNIVIKNYLDIYSTLKPKQKLSTIPDLISFEITVEEFKDCYLALGYLHQLYHPVTGSITDLIATSEETEYRSINTIVSGLKERPIELKISSKPMSLVNDYGLAVLEDKYPEKNIEEIKHALSKSNKFINALQSIDLLYQNDDEFIRQVSEEILSIQIKVFSKDGEIYSIPKGATVLDFAFKIHSEIGKKAIGAFVNNKEVKANHVLKNNDSVNIIIDEEQTHQPKESLDYVITAKAKRKIKEDLNEIK